MQHEQSDRPTPYAFRVPAAVSWSGLPRTTIFELLRTGAVKSVKVGRARLVLADSLRKYLDDQASG